MLTVGSDWSQVESLLAERALACPACGGVLAGWSHARRRVIRTLRPGVRLVLRPRRARCRHCRVTHVLLPARLLARRADDIEVVGTALELAAAGHGTGRIARLLQRPAPTVRGWLRRARRRAGAVRSGLAGWVLALDPDPPPIEPSGSAWGDVVCMLAAVARAAAARWPELRPPGSVPMLSLWRMAAVVTNGSLLSPTVTFRRINTNRPLVTFCH